MGLTSRLARSAASARRPAIGLDREWVKPAWLERQLDPDGAGYLPQSLLPGPVNLSDRAWTAIGNIASPHRAVVDRCGLLTPWPGSWSLDWWVGAEDRWHFPSRERNVRQGLVGTSPVVETLMRVPGGDVVCRTYAVVGAGGFGDVAVVELENRSAVPVAAALAVRPYNVEGFADVRRIERRGDGVIMVDGLPALLLPRRPSLSFGSTLAGGDVARRLLAGESDDPFEPVVCPDGRAQAVVVFPVSHSSSLRVAVPLDPSPDDAGRSPGPLPSGVDVARAWDAQSRRPMRMVVPPGRLADALDANRKHVLLAFGGEEAVLAPSAEDAAPLDEQAAVITALDRFGFSAEANELLDSLVATFSDTGSFGGDTTDRSGTAAVLAAMAHHWRLTRDEDMVRSVLPVVQEAAAALGRRGRGRARPARRSAGARATPLDEDAWVTRGLLDAAALLRAGGAADDAAAAADTAAARLTSLGDADHAAPEGGGPQKVMTARLARCDPLQLTGAADAGIRAALSSLRATLHGAAVLDAEGGIGLSTRATLSLAAVECAAGDEGALERLRWLVSVATDTFTWAEGIHPFTGRGCAGEGHDLVVAAEFLTLVRNLLVREGPPEERPALRLVGLLPPEWVGHGLEVYEAPTAFGTLSFAVRWHGPRPALLWELSRPPGLGPVVLTAPGLDPVWSSSDPAGEALLQAKPPDPAVAPLPPAEPSTPPGGDGASFT